MASGSTIVWRVTPAEHVRAVTDLSRYYAKRERRLVRELRRVAVAMLAVGAAAWIVWRWRTTGAFPLAITIALAVTAALIAVFAFTRPWALRRAARRQLTKNPLA